MKYAILINNKHYLTYNKNSDNIILSEFNILNENLNFAKDIKLENICGLNYLIFDAEDIKKYLTKISTLSFLLGIFEYKDGYLKPIEKEFKEFINPNISSILKYSGKTNEYFTRLMINIGSYILNKNENLNILDPICGKGTTLYESLVNGYNCYGIEIATKVVDEIAVFLRKYLENERYKFSYKKEKLSGENKSFKAEKHIFNINKNKESKDNKHFEVVSVNTVFADKILKKDYYDLIIGDLPYGVKHSNITNEKQNSFTRSPKELLEKSLDSWKKVLNKDGLLIMSWNTFLLKRNEFEKLLINKGFEVVKNENLLSFEHRVDQAINRDFICIKK